TMDQGALEIRVDPDRRRDAVRWRALATSNVGSFGDPSTTTSYALCVLDSRPGATNELLTAVAPAGGTGRKPPGWSIGTGGIRHHDRAATPDGLRDLSGRGKRALGAPVRWSVSGGGTSLRLPSQLPVGETLSAALVAHDGTLGGACWGTTFPRPSVSTAQR